MICRYFIADLHLTESDPIVLAGFFHFLQQLPKHCELYILGDFFDYWVGDDVMNEIQIKIAKSLAHLKKKQINVFFMCGNRDFLVGEEFAKQAQLILLPDYYFIPETQTLLLHGDLLCTQDEKYQQFRVKIHQKWRQRLFLRLPKRIRLWIAQKIRQKSQKMNQVKSYDLMNVNPKAVRDLLSQYQATTLIHGHTHQPEKEVIIEPNQAINATRFVFAAWHDSFNYIYQDEFGIYHVIYF